VPAASGGSDSAPVAPKVTSKHRNLAAVLAAFAALALLAIMTWRSIPRPDNQTATTASHPEQPSQARNAYLRGQYDWHQRTNGWKRGCEYFTVATQKDPRYAAAYAALSNCYRLLVGYNALTHKEGYAKAKEAAGKAIVLDPTSAA